MFRHVLRDLFAKVLVTLLKCLHIGVECLVFVKDLLELVPRILLNNLDGLVG